MSRVLDRVSFDALGTACAVRIVCSPLELPLARMAAAAARAEVIACERVLSRFDPSSDLARINASPGSWAVVDIRVVEALEAALRFESETDGRCSPFLLTALDAAGYDRSFVELVERGPRTAEKVECLVEIDRAACRIRVSAGTLDLGGTAKGLIAMRALRAAQRCWPGVVGALVDLGGDLAVTGVAPAGGSWIIDVDDPASGGPLGAIRLAAGGVATSGPTRRRFGPGRALHHLIDPVTRASAAHGPRAATVVAPDPVAADAHATALAITPVGDAEAYIAARPGLGAILAMDDGPPLVLGTVDFASRRELVG